jgi:hypothetical protein
MKDVTTGDFIKVTSLYKDGSFDYYILKVTDISVIRGITIESSIEEYLFEETTHHMTSKDQSYDKITDINKIKELELKRKFNLLKNS